MADYSNPFDDEGTGDPFQQSGAAAGMPPPRPAARPAFNTNAPPPSGRSTMTEEQLRAKEIELARREQLLEYKERKVEEVKVNLEKGKPPPNFPKCWPLWYHNINEEIPKEGRNLVKRMYAAWIISLVCYCLNAIANLAAMIGEQSSGNTGIAFGLSLLYLIIGPFVSFTFWYRPFYYAVRKNRSISYFIFFFNFSFHILFCILMAIGIQQTGGAGFVAAVSDGNVGSGVILFISGVMWALLSVYCVFQIITAFRYYKNPPKLPEGPQDLESGNAGGPSVDVGGVTVGGVAVPAGTKVTFGA